MVLSVWIVERKNIFDKKLFIIKIDLKIQISTFSFIFPPLNLELKPPGTYNPNACRRSNSLWTKTLDRYTGAGLPECVVSTISGPSPEITQHRTQRTHTQSQEEIKIPEPAGNRTRATGLEGRDSTDHATTTNVQISLNQNCYYYHVVVVGF